MSATAAAPYERIDQDRQQLHRSPELAYEERRTAALVAGRLRDLGLEVQEGVAGTGVTATLRGSRHGRTLMLRAELDAIPVQEDTGLAFSSTQAGVMHACGHDAHMAILLAVARTLSQDRASLAGEVRFVFQPAEEIGLGAAAMIADGVLDPGVDGFLALHMHAHLPAGSVGICRGPACASASRFEVAIQGRGGHGAFPHASADPIVPAAALVLGLQTLVSREVSALDRAVLSVCSVRAGNAFNVLPDRAELSGTIRAAHTGTHRQLMQRTTELAEATAVQFRCTADVTHDELCPAVENDDGMAELVRAAASACLPAEAVLEPPPVMASDDVALFLQRVPGCYFFVGVAPTDGSPQHPHHSSTFRVDERALPAGYETMLAAARSYLGGA